MPEPANNPTSVTFQTPAVTTPPVQPGPQPEGATPPAEAPLGAPGLAALQSERARVAELQQQLAAATDRITEFEQRDLTELDRIKAANEQLATDLSTERATRLRLEIAAEYELAGDDLVLLTATDEAGLRAQAARIQAKNTAAATAAGSAPLPGQGTPATAATTASIASGRALYEQQRAKNS